MSVFDRNFNNSNSSNIESKFLELVRFRINLLTIRQNLNRIFYNASDIEGNYFMENQNCLQNSLQKNSFSGSFHTWIKKFFCEKKNVFINQIFRPASHFETRFSKRVRFWAKIFKHVIFWGNFLKLVWFWIEKPRTCQIIKFSWKSFKVFGVCQVLNLVFNHPSVIKSKISKSIRFWYNFFSEKMLVGKHAFQNFFSVVVFYRKKIKSLGFWSFYGKSDFYIDIYGEKHFVLN